MSNDTLDIHTLIAQAKPRRYRALIIVVGVIVLALAAYFLLRSEDKGALRFVTALVERGDLTITVTATGTLAPVNQVDVGSEISGTIESVKVDFNDRVQRGQVLARLSTEEQRARVVQSRAALEVARARVLQAAATLNESELRYKRCQTLAQQGLCAPQDLDTLSAVRERAMADEISARAQVSQAEAVLDAEQSRLAKAEIRSPINGIVLKRNIEPGQTVAASLQAPVLFTLAESLGQMELRVAVDEADIGKVRTGQQATFTVDAYGERSFPAAINQVRLAPQSTAGVVSYETILAVDNQDLALRPGMTATARIIVEQIHDALLLPNAALRFSPPPAQPVEQRSFMDQLFPRWGSRTPRERGAAGNRQKQVWILRAQQPVAINVRTGSSDGRMTQLLEGEVAAGAQLLVDVASEPAR